MNPLVFAALSALLPSWPFSGDVPPDVIVARATTGSGVIEISAGRLRRYCERHPERSPRDAAEALIEFEVLALEAAARELSRAPAVRRAGSAVAVPLYLKRAFEAEANAAAVPLDFLRKVYERNAGFYHRAELRVADHLLISAPGWVRPTDAALDAAGRALAERVAAELSTHPPADAAAFRALAERFQPEAVTVGLAIKAENLPAFAEAGQYERDFSAAAFALARPGGVSPLVETRYGFHLIRVDEIMPPVDKSFEAARAEITERMLPEFRAMEFRHRTDALLEAAGVALNLALIGIADPAP